MKRFPDRPDDYSRLIQLLDNFVVVFCIGIGKDQRIEPIITSAILWFGENFKVGITGKCAQVTSRNFTF